MDHRTQTQNRRAEQLPLCPDVSAVLGAWMPSAAPGCGRGGAAGGRR